MVHAKTIVIASLLFIHINASCQTKKDSLLVLAYDDVRSFQEQFDVLCEIAYIESDCDSIIFYSDLALKIAENKNLHPTRALVYKGKGFWCLGQLDEALRVFLEAAKIEESANKLSGMGVCYMYISDTYGLLEDYRNSILYLEKAIRIFEKNTNSEKYPATLLNLGFQYYKIGNYKLALEKLRQSQAYFIKLGHQRGLAYSYGNIGLVFSETNQLDSAKSYLKRGIGMLSDLNDEYGLNDFRIEYSAIMSKLGNHNLALGHAKQCMAIAVAHSNANQIRDAALRLSEVFATLQKHDSALVYFKMYHNTADSIKNLNAIQRMANLRTEFEVEKKQAEVDVLEKKRKSQRFIIIGLILGIAISALLIYLYYRAMKRAGKLSSLLDLRMKELSKQRKELEDLNKIKNRFFSIISHDLRGPISSLGGISLLLKENLANDREDISSEIIEYVDNTVVSLSSLLDNLLNWALCEERKFPYVEKVLNAKELVEESIKMYSTLIISKEIKVTIQNAEGCFFKGDENMLLTIIRNLVSNAVKFSEHGGILNISSTTTQDNRVEIKVVDQGMGIPEDKLKTLFKLRENKSTRGSNQEKGLGLGLNLVYEFVQKNKGEINVESSINKGTTFNLLFPLVH